MASRRIGLLPRLERPEEVADLIRTCVGHIEPERLIVTFGCGFGRPAMSRIQADFKMVLLVRGANIVRKEFGLEKVHIPACDPHLSMVPGHRHPAFCALPWQT